MSSRSVFVCPDLPSSYQVKQYGIAAMSEREIFLACGHIEGEDLSKDAYKFNIQTGVYTKLSGDFPRRKLL